MLSEEQINEYAREAGTTPDATELSGDAIYRFARAIEGEARQQALEEAALACEGIYCNGDGAEHWLKWAAEKIRAIKETT